MASGGKGKLQRTVGMIQPAKSTSGLVSGMMSGILSPRKDKSKNHDKPNLEDEGYVEISETDTLIDSDYESDDDKPPKGHDLAKARSFQMDGDSDEEISIYDDQVYSFKRQFAREEEITSDDDLDPDDAESSPPARTHSILGLFAKFNHTTNADEEFETISPEEAEGADNGRAARLKAAMELVKRKDGLRKAAPSPEQLRCPCLYDEKDGWKRCPSDAHKELAKLVKTT